MPLKLMYITNDPEIAIIAEKCGVDRVWVDLETLGKEERQKNLDTVKSQHSIDDIKRIKPLLTSSELLVRVNSWNEDSVNEINSVIEAGADIIMLPYWKTVGEVKKFIEVVEGRAKTTLLLETKEAVDCIDSVIELTSFDEIHIGLNDLHLSYNLSFMFELLTNGVVEKLCEKFSENNIPYGFGGIARLGEGELPSENILMEHFRLGSTRVILSRSFCNVENFHNYSLFESEFSNEIFKLRQFENKISAFTQKELSNNKDVIKNNICKIISSKGNR